MYRAYKLSYFWTEITAEKNFKMALQELAIR